MVGNKTIKIMTHENHVSKRRDRKEEKEKKRRKEGRKEGRNQRESVDGGCL